MTLIFNITLFLEVGISHVFFLDGHQLDLKHHHENLKIYN